VLAGAARPAIIGAVAACAALWWSTPAPAITALLVTYLLLLVVTRTLTAADLVRWRG
jgi:hypothetical protein